MPATTYKDSSPPRALLTLLHLLNDYSLTDKIRAFLVTDFRTGHKFCPLCSLTCSIPGTCGPTCALLSPHTYAPLKLDPIWLSRALQDQAIYRNVLHEVKACGGNASRGKIREWETKMQRLRHWAMNDCERREALGWNEHYEKITETKGLNLEWVFERAWRDRAVEEVKTAFEDRKAPVEETEVQVTVAVTRKRKAEVEEVQQVDLPRMTRSQTKRRKLACDGKSRKRVKRKRSGNE